MESAILKILENKLTETNSKITECLCEIEEAKLVIKSSRELGRKLEKEVLQLQKAIKYMNKEQDIV